MGCRSRCSLETAARTSYAGRQLPGPGTQPEYSARSTPAAPSGLRARAPARGRVSRGDLQADRCVPPGALIGRGGEGHGAAAAAAPLVTMGWLASQAPAPPAPSLAQMVCTAKVPVASARSNDPPLVPGVIQAHLSAVSSPEASVQPPGGFWSVMVSAYSWPLDDGEASSRPAAAGVDEVLAAAGAQVGDVGHVGERDVTVGRGHGPTNGSPFQSCHAQNVPLGPNPSGWVPVGERMTYCALRLSAAVVLPKWAAALTASVPSWAAVAVAGRGARRRRTRHRPARRRWGSRRARRAGRAGLGADRDALAVLGHHAGPQLVVRCRGP